mmetsp:Transcript_34192/g.33393  ORF Transcript_34192/g.33393 Transcript_34192/m.33393 type:complete len:120 (-) Transcript_34192:294-653(-)
MLPMQMGKSLPFLAEGLWKHETFAMETFVQINTRENFNFFFYMIPFPGPMEVPKVFYDNPPGPFAATFTLQFGPQANLMSYLLLLTTTDIDANGKSVFGMSAPTFGTIIVPGKALAALE